MNQHPAYPPPPGYHPPPPGYRPPLPQPLSPGGQPLADFGTRLLAYLIDGAILSAVATAVFVPVILIFTFSQMSAISEETAAGSTATPEFSAFFVQFLLLELALIVILLLAYYIYFVQMMFKSGQTIGKKAMKIRVVPLDPAAQLTRGMASKRYLVEIVAATIIPFFGWLNGLWQLWDKPYQQALHDKFAQTVVIRVGP